MDSTSSERLPTVYTADTRSYSNMGMADIDPGGSKYRKPNRKERRRIESISAQWNRNRNPGKMLHEVLGMTLTEYGRYLNTGDVPITF